MSEPDKGKIVPQRPEREQDAPPNADVRPGADAPPPSEHLGGTERDVISTTPPTRDTLTESEEETAADEIDPDEEITPG